MTWLKLFDIVPGWVYALALAGVLSLAGVQSVRLSASQLEVAKLGKQMSDEKAERERVAREDAQEVARIQSRHAAMQQEISNANSKRAADRAVTVRDIAADLQRLRTDIVEAARSGDEGAVDPAACRRDGDLSRQLSRDLAEALGLQGEAEAVIRQRDDEVRTLLDQIATDRAAVK